MSSSDLALELSRKHKRLLYWKDVFSKKNVPAKTRGEVDEALQTYGLLISRLAQGSENPAEMKDATQRISALERRLTSLFEARRMSTTPCGEAFPHDD